MPLKIFKNIPMATWRDVNLVSEVNVKFAIFNDMAIIWNDKPSINQPLSLQIWQPSWQRQELQKNKLHSFNKPKYIY